MKDIKQAQNKNSTFSQLKTHFEEITVTHFQYLKSKETQHPKSTKTFSSSFFFFFFNNSIKIDLQLEETKRVHSKFPYLPINAVQANRHTRKLHTHTQWVLNP